MVLETASSELTGSTERRSDDQQAPPETAESPIWRVLRHPALRWAALAALVLLDLVIPAAYAREWERILPTLHLDGSFQTASGLFRISSGQWPGKDFFPYLGIGPVLFLYPVFVLRGGDLAASVFSARFMTLIVLELVFGVVAALVFRRRSAWTFAWAAIVPMLLLQAARTWQGMSSLNSTCGNCLGLVSVASDPGNSLRPIRAFAPYLLAGIAYLVLRSGWSVRTRFLVVGACAGVVAALWSNDYGLVSGGLLLLAVTVYAVMSRPRHSLGAVLGLWAAALVSFVVAGMGATAGHFLPYLSYNFSDVRGDQFWYFGPWDEGTRVYSLGDLLRIMSTEYALFPVAVLAVTLVAAAVRRHLAWLLLAYLGAALFVGGAIGTMGGHAGSYFWALVLWGYVVPIIAAARAARFLVGRAVRHRSAPVRARTRYVARAVLAVAVVGSLVVADSSEIATEREAGRQLDVNSAFVYEPQLGGSIDSRFEAHLDLFRERRTGVVEEYMGLAGALVGPRTDLRVDSVIAALGKQRARYARAMAAHPDVVVTTAPGIDDWVTWNLSANWWFYRTLFKSYAPEQTSPTTLVWKPAEPAEWTAVPCTVRGGALFLDAPRGGLYEVTVHYRGPGRNSRTFTMVQNNIDIIGKADGFVALDPGARSQQFPVAIADGGNGPTRLTLRDVPASGSPLTTLTSCSASTVTPPAQARTMQVFSRLFPTPEAYTDQRWTNGVSTTRAGFFVVDSGPMDAALRRSKAVRFSDGQVRKIVRLEGNWPYLDVFLSGPPLDPAVAGFPNQFQLVHR